MVNEIKDPTTNFFLSLRILNKEMKEISTENQLENSKCIFLVYLSFRPLRKDEEKRRVCALRKDSRGQKFYGGTSLDRTLSVYRRHNIFRLLFWT